MTLFDGTDVLAINTLRVLAVDVTTKANSGHAGTAMALAPVGYVLFDRFLNFDPRTPGWLNRDRFVLSNGHACILQYALLHVYGYDLSIEDLKSSRKLGSLTPGHPESRHTPGVEITTGPLGQGFANAVGMAIAQAHNAAVFNKPGFELFTNYTYCFFGDGCAMEGIASEAASLAGHLKLGNLIMVYDDNRITIDGSTDITFTENVLDRFKAYGWHVQSVENGDTDLDGIYAAVEEARKVLDKPSLIKLTTTIGFGSSYQGHHSLHANPLRLDDCKAIKARFGFDLNSEFAVPAEVYKRGILRVSSGTIKRCEWEELLSRYEYEFPSDHRNLVRQMAELLPEGWEQHLPIFNPTDKALATRKVSEMIIASLQGVIPELLGGSADLTPSNLSIWDGAVDFQAPSTGLGDYSGRYIRYGIREHAMAGIMNGIASYGMNIPYAGTFLNFLSYAAGSIRVSAIAQLRAIYIATHDSIGLGEDGPTHQPIETLAHFRAMPNLMVWHPADGNETCAAYAGALSLIRTPSVIALSRQAIPQLPTSSIKLARRGGYVVLASAKPDIVLVSTGSEVHLCLEAAKLLQSSQGINTQVVSLPCWEVFDAQDMEYKLQCIPDGVPVLSVEALSTLGWGRFAHKHFGIDQFGVSGPGEEVFKLFDFVPEGVCKRALAVVQFYKNYGLLPSPIRNLQLH